LLVGCGNAPCRCQELIAKLVKPRPSRRPVAILLGAGVAGVPKALGFADPFLAETLVPFPGGGVSVGEFDEVPPGIVSAGVAASLGSGAVEPFLEAG